MTITTAFSSATTIAKGVLKEKNKIHQSTIIYPVKLPFKHKLKEFIDSRSAL